MKLYNQIRQRLNFDIARKKFECEPYGHVIVPDELVEFVKRRGLPLLTTEVPVSQRSAAHAAEAKKVAESDELILLRKEKIEAVDALTVAQKALEETQLESEKRLDACKRAAARIDELTAHLEGAREENSAHKKTIEEQALQIADLESQIALLNAKQTEGEKTEKTPEGDSKKSGQKSK